MSEAFLGEIRIFSMNYAPYGWALCNGQILSIAQNQALFALLGISYGGNGVTTFALPDLRGRVPTHRDSTSYAGSSGGVESTTLVVSQLPQHTHGFVTTNANATARTAAGNLLAAPETTPLYATASSVQTANESMLGQTGGWQPFNNMQPYLVLNFCIALQGIFPSRN